VIYRNGVQEIDCGVLVNGPFTGDGSVVSTSTPGGLVATVAHFGPYNRMGDAYDALNAWCSAHGHKLIGPSWELYGHWSDDPAQLRTDIFWVVEDTGQSAGAAP
jgi:effector-binding domain-containing protein